MDTITAIATPSGRGAMGIVRLSGQGVSILLKEVFSQKKKQVLQPRQLTLGIFMSGSDIIDECTAVFFPSPYSYTGEDMVEFYMHGSPFILNKAQERLIALGARRARPGEFTMRAFMNGKLTLAQAEAVEELTMAESEARHKAALSSLSGSQAPAVAEIETVLKKCAVVLEASLEFPEEDDIVAMDAASPVQKELTQLKEKIQAHITAFETYIRSRDGIRCVLCGRPNVGKSSLFNRLIGADKAIVTHIPGTTTDVLYAGIFYGGHMITLFDTAGLRDDPATVIEEIGKRKTFEHLEEAHIALVIEDDEIVRNGGTYTPPPYVDLQKTILVVNKTDTLTDAKLKRAKHIFAGVGHFHMVSAETGYGIEDLKQRITALYEQSHKDVQDSPSLLVTERQKDIFSAIQGAVTEAISHYDSVSIDLAAEEVRNALSLVAEFTGKSYSAEVLDSIFDTFCIGK